MSAGQLRRSLALWQRRLAYREKRLKVVRRSSHRGGIVTHPESAQIKKWERLRDEAKRMVARRNLQLDHYRPLNERAAMFAHTLVGIMEEGGNNVGPRVSRIIRANGGTPGEAWCGDFVAFVYRHVGSKAVNRSWASVYWLGRVLGVKRTTKPVVGDLVRFKFDHVGLFIRDLGNEILTLEGNTGASGAVSDSPTGGDGVYEKKRHKSLVRDYLHVTK